MSRAWRALLVAFVLAAAALLELPPGTRAFTAIGFSLGLDQRDVRLFNNLADPEANDNTTPDPNWPGYTGAALAIWKAVAEWGSTLHGDGSGDPSQPFDVGSGGANFDATWQGLASSVGAVNDNVVSATHCGGGVISVLERIGPSGWRIRFCDEWTWDDGPGPPVPNALDLQGIFAHEYGHALGLGHTNVDGATMSSSTSGNGVSLRSIEADDVAGVQFIYGAAAASKPKITRVTGTGVITIAGTGFSATGNEVWFTRISPSPDGVPIKVTGVVSTGGGAQIVVALPAGAGPGDVLVRAASGSGASLSNAWPLQVLDPCSLPSIYCTAKTNSIGCTSAIAFSGNPSASASSGFTLSASNLLNQKPGLLFYGTSGDASVPFQGGFLCVKAPVVRTGVQSSGGSLPPANDCTGTFAFDFNAWIASGADPALVPGQSVWAQFWSRDPGFAPPESTNLTDAVSFEVCD